EQKLPGRRVGKLWRSAESTVADVEQAGHLARGALQGRRRDLAALRLVERLDYVAADRLCILGHFVALLAIDARHLFAHAADARLAVVILLRWEVSAAEEDLALGGHTGWA